MKIGEIVWFNGELKSREDCKIDLLTHALHYGTGVFEGIRAYEQPNGRAGIFRLKKHMERLQQSAKVLGFSVPYSVDELCTGAKETVSKNNLKTCYIRPLAFIGSGPLGMSFGKTPPIQTAIMTWEWGSYLGDDGINNGIRVKTSSQIRPHVNSVMTKGKITGNYAMGVVAKQEALSLGYDEALLLDPNGYVCEGSGENLFALIDGKILTPPRTSILPGITRNSVLTLLESQGLRGEEALFTRDDLYFAEEVFMCGTAAEITPVSEIDGRKIKDGKPGALTKKIQSLYMDSVQGKHPEFSKKWVTVV